MSVREPLGTIQVNAMFSSMRLMGKLDEIYNTFDALSDELANLSVDGVVEGWDTSLASNGNVTLQHTSVPCDPQMLWTTECCSPSTSKDTLHFGGKDQRWP